jgi:predicted transposase YbfD/YdcC
MTFVDKYFDVIKDPRVVGRCTYPLKEMFLVALTSTICGGKGYEDMADFGEDRIDFLKTFYPFKAGTPKKDAFRNLFSILDHKQFENCFSNWARSLSDKPGDSIAIDGKCLCGSKAKDSTFVHMLSAWCDENSLILGQVAISNKSNEITAIPELLNLLDIENKVISLDAMGCQREIAELIIKKKGDYVFSLKGNQGSIHQEVKEFFQAHETMEYKDGVFHFEEKTQKGHGRTEIRKYTFTTTLDWGLESHKWPGLKGVGKVESTRKIKGKESHETRYFLTSLESEPERFVRTIRKHWGVENKVHWILDVPFDEDHCRIRTNNGAKNMAIIRHYAINTIRKYGNPKRSMRRNMIQAAAKSEILQKLISGVV